jgi:hypothetical protein
MGEGRHSRFSLHSGGHRALAVAFGRSSVPDGEEPVDAAVGLEVNHWNGSVEPRLVLRELYPAAEPDREGEGGGTEPAHACGSDGAEWWERLEAELDADLDAWPGNAWKPAEDLERRRALESSGSAASVLAELVSSGESVLALCADASRRAELALGAAGLARFGGGAGVVACGRCVGGPLERAAGERGLVLADWDALARAPASAAAFTHVVVVDPPPFPYLEEAIRGARGGGFLHPVWGDSERRLAFAVLNEQLGLRAQLSATYRGLRGEPRSGAELLAALRGDGRFPRSPELAGRCLRVLDDLGLTDGKPSAGAGAVGVVSSETTELTRSLAFRAYAARHEEARRYLERRRHP